MPKKKRNINKSLSEAARLLGKAGGTVGGPARARVLSKSERSEIASEGGKAKAAKAMSRNKGRKAIAKAARDKRRSES